MDMCHAWLVIEYTITFSESQIYEILISSIKLILFNILFYFLIVRAKRTIRYVNGILKFFGSIPVI